VKNAPYDSLEEAHLIRGVGDDFWSTFVDPDPANPKKRVMTVWGQGPINVNTASPQAVLAVVCGLAPDSVICTDLAKTQQFLTMFGVLRTFTSGMPLFGTANDFVATIQGGGAYGKLLFSTIGIPPVRFQSPAEAAKNFTTESKVFSIYATGEVNGVRTTNLIRVHAVVDFRGAPAIPNSPMMAGMPGMPGSAPGTQMAAPSPSSSAGPAVANAGGVGALPAGASADAIAGALMANPAGAVVYYRIE
jgi:general secretion pathway protein K